MLTAVKLVKDSPNHLMKMRRITNLGSISECANLKNRRSFATRSSEKIVKMPITPPSHTHSLAKEFPGKNIISNSHLTIQELQKSLLKWGSLY
jgi:hypothetical protein